MAKVTRVVDRKRDITVVTTLTPKAMVWKLIPGETNDEYEDFMDKLSSGAYIPISTDGNWHEGAYLVQTHYYEVEKKEEQPTDVDRETDIDDLKKMPEGRPDDIIGRLIPALPEDGTLPDLPEISKEEFGKANSFEGGVKKAEEEEEKKPAAKKTTARKPAAKKPHQKKRRLSNASNLSS